jgi:hypothetical protein
VNLIVENTMNDEITTDLMVYDEVIHLHLVLQLMLAHIDHEIIIATQLLGQQTLGILVITLISDDE